MVSTAYFGVRIKKQIKKIHFAAILYLLGDKLIHNFIFDVPNP